jgi:PPOX class probable F420-dependent enzyme
MIGAAEHDDFIARSVIAIVSTLRSDGSPSTSMVCFARHGDRLLFSTTMSKAKAKMLKRDGRAAMTILNADDPLSFVSVEGDVTIHEDNPIELREIFLKSTAHPSFPMGAAEVEMVIAQPGRAMFELVPTRVSGVVTPRLNRSH